MGSPERPKGNIFKKAVGFARVPIAAAILTGCATTDLGIPICAEDPRPKTRTEALVPATHGLTDELSVDGVTIKAVLPVGRIEAKSSPRVKNYHDGHVEFQGRRNGRHYSINAKPDTTDSKYTSIGERAIPSNVTVVTIQADCETPTLK